MKIKSKFKTLVITNLVGACLLVGCSPTNQIDIIDDQGNIVEKPEGYDELPAGLEEIKEQEVSEEKPKMELQNLEDLRDKETGYVPLEKANEWLANKMKEYKEVDRVYDEETGLTKVFYVSKDGTELEVRILHPYGEDGISVLKDQVLQILLGERDLSTIKTLDDNASN